MRKAKRANPNKAPRAVTVQLPAPIKGWVAQGSPVEAVDGTALILDNYFCEAQTIRPRAGFAAHVEGVADAVETLMYFKSATTGKIFAVGDGDIYDVTSAGALPAASVTGLTSDRLQWLMFATSGGQYLIYVNGADSLGAYSGAAWSTPSITAVTSSTLINVSAHKSRLWFCQKDTADLWYLPVDSIAGTAVKFPVGAQLTKGGYPMATGTWSLDSGSGPDDLFVVVSSEGEVLIYQGTDPSAADTWGLVGRYTTGKPMGRRCLHPVGGDLLVITDIGLVSIAQILKYDVAAQGKKALTYAIRDEFARVIDLNDSGPLFGWQMVVHPHKNMALLNVPQGGDNSENVQFAYNVTTGAWSRFIGWDAECWVSAGNEIYFGTSDGGVYRAEYGGDDDGAVISTRVLPAFSNLGFGGRLKHVKMVQPIFSTTVNVSPGLAVAVDYKTPSETSGGETNYGTYFTWDVSYWDGGHVWRGIDTINDWRGTSNIGTVVSPYTAIDLDTSSNTDATFNLIGWTILYEAGGVV